MKYCKPALSLDEQLDQLARRGMQVPDRARALHHLRHISYYRLRAYWLPWEIPADAPGDHQFLPDTCFNDIIALYSFDRRLRLLIMDAIERFEVSLRARWAYVLGMRYGPHAHCEPDLFYRRSQHEKCLAKLMEELSRSQETFALHYRKTYSSPEVPPLWSACELLTFGQLSLWYSNLRHAEDRKEIAAAYQIDEQILKSFAHHLTYVRNVCAHHSRLWNRELTIQMKLPKHPSEICDAFNANAPKRVYNTLVMLAHLMKQISPGSDWHASVLHLMSEHPKIDFAAMGFIAEWQEQLVWQHDLCA